MKIERLLTAVLIALLWAGDSNSAQWLIGGEGKLHDSGGAVTSKGAATEDGSSDSSAELSAEGQPILLDKKLNKEQSSIPVATQPTTAQKPNPAPSPTPIKIGSVTFSGSLRARIEDWDWFDTSIA